MLATFWLTRRSTVCDLKKKILSVMYPETMRIMYNLNYDIKSLREASLQSKTSLLNVSMSHQSSANAEP